MERTFVVHENKKRDTGSLCALCGMESSTSLFAESESNGNAPASLLLLEFLKNFLLLQVAHSQIDSGMSSGFALLVLDDVSLDSSVIILKSNYNRFQRTDEYKATIHKQGSSYDQESFPFVSCIATALGRLRKRISLSFHPS